MDLGVAGNGYLVVGGTTGMGLATAKVLAAEGASLVVAGRDGERAAKVAAELSAEHGGTVIGMAADVHDDASVQALVASAVEQLGGLRGVAILTGVLGHTTFDVDDASWEAAFDDVLLGTVRVVRAALPAMIAGGGGSIVTTSAFSIHSVASVRIPYGAMKSAVATFTKGIAKTHGPDGIRANCIAPGAIETEGMHAMRGMLAEQRGWPFEEAIERIMETEWDLKVGLRRPGRPQEVGELISFLLSERAGYLTGALLNIDGGTDF